MTAAQKKARRQRIERVNEHRQRRTMTVWLSRDAEPGDVPVDEIRVWLVKPKRKHFDDGSVAWVVPGGDPDAKVQTAEGPVRALFGSYTIELCLREHRTYPDDSRMLIVVGNEPEPALITATSNAPD